MALQNSGILVSLKITQWSARKLDRGTSFEVCKTKHADQGSGSFNKQIIPKKYLANINQLVNKIRNYHYANTLAWEHKGSDLLPSRNYFKYMTRMGELQDQFTDAVAEFIKHYDTVVAQVQNNLNDLYDIGDYPSPSEINRKFYMEITTTPIPAAGDFRIDINNKELDKLKSKLAEQLNQAELAAEKDLFSRLYTTLAKTIVTLGDPNAIFRNSLIFNIEDICTKIPDMNITDNQNLNRVAHSILTYCKEIDIDKLREDQKYRKFTTITYKAHITKVEQIYEQLDTSGESKPGDQQATD